MKALSYSFYVNGRFVTNNNLISAPDGQTTDFISLRWSDQKISCHELLLRIV